MNGNRAFEANAVNYLMKPVDEDKLADTIERVRQRLAEKKSTEEAEKLKSVLSEVAPEAAENLAGEDPEAASRFEKLINVKDRGQIFRVEVGTIEHIDTVHSATQHFCMHDQDTGDCTCKCSHFTNHRYLPDMHVVGKEREALEQAVVRLGGPVALAPGRQLGGDAAFPVDQGAVAVESQGGEVGHFHGLRSDEL